jgi:hypothetical protein
MRAHRLYRFHAAGFKLIAYLATTMLLLTASLAAQQTNCEEGAGPLSKDQPSGVSPQQIIEKFSARESSLKQAQMNYTYVMDITVQSLEGQTVTGEFRQVSTIHWEHGARKEIVSFAPQSTLRGIWLGKEDFEDIYRSPFILAREDLSQYTLLYSGQQRVDEVETYVFEVAPKLIEKGKRYFQGRVWVDKVDAVVLKACGKSVPDSIAQPSQKKKKRRGVVEENITPTVVTYRELIDGKYWFPTYVRSDDTIHFSTNDVRVREIIKYKEYKLWDGTSSTTAQTPARPKKK